MDTIKTIDNELNKFAGNNVVKIATIDKIDNNEVDKNSNLFTSKFDKFDKAYHYFVFYPPTSKTYLIKRYIDFLEENFIDNDDKYVYYVGKCEK